MPIVFIDTNPQGPLPVGVPNDGAQVPWLGAVLIRDYVLNKAQGLPVRGVEPLWEGSHAGLPAIWPLTGEMQDVGP